MESRTKILIADDQLLFAEGLRFVIESRAPDFKIVDIAENGAAAVKKAGELRPDVVLMDVRMPEMDGVEATRIICERYPEQKVLILTTFDDDEYVKFSIQHGAVGYILKNRPPVELIETIRALRDGNLQIDPAVSKKLFNAPKMDDPEANDILRRLEDLSSREVDVLRLLVQAERIPRIAEQLFISENTVRNHISNIYAKLDIHTRIEIVRYVAQIRHFLEKST